jgi:hypothetical protein
MLRIPRPEDLRALLRGGQKPRVSLYLTSPESHGFADLEAVQGRWRGLVGRARALLVESGADPAPVLAKLSGSEPGPTDLPHGEWTLALFADASSAHAFALPQRTADACFVGDEPVLLPLLAAARSDLPYRVLVLSTKHVALFEGRRGSLSEVARNGVPASLEEALGGELRKKEDIQHYGFQAGGGTTVYHGQGGASDERSHDLERFHKAVAKAVEKRWAGREDPLVLAADETHAGRFRAVAHLHGLIEQGLHGGSERLPARELHARAWPLVEKVVEGRIAARFEALGRSRAAHRVVEGLQPALEAASAGRVGRLWIGAGAARGGPDPVQAARPIDALVAEVVRHGGEVDVLEPDKLPGETLYAELRA